MKILAKMGKVLIFRLLCMIKMIEEAPIGLRDCGIGLIFLRDCVKMILFLRDCVNRLACVMRENVEKCA